MPVEDIPLIKKDLQVMSESIKDLKTDMQAHRNDTALRHKEFQDFREELFEKLEKRFASKWVEKFLIFVLSAGWLVIIGAFMALIIKK